MFCVNKNKRQRIEDRGTATNIKVIGHLTQSDFDYIRNSNIVNLDLSEVEITEIGNNSNWTNRYKSTFGVSVSLYNSQYINSFCESKFKSVVLPKKLKVTKGWAFNSCPFLASINIPSSVTTIGDNTFYDCKSLAFINIPSLTVIGEYAFSNCPSNPRRCNMISCECGYCYPEGEPEGHQLINSECGMQVGECCLKHLTSVCKRCNIKYCA